MKFRCFIEDATSLKLSLSLIICKLEVLYLEFGYSSMLFHSSISIAKDFGPEF